MSRVNQSSAFEYAQNAQIQIALHMRKVLSGPKLSMYTYCYIQCFYYRTVNALIRLRGCADAQGDLGSR